MTKSLKIATPLLVLFLALVVRDGAQAAGTWQTLSSMADERRHHSATVLSDGRIL